MVRVIFCYAAFVAGLLTATTAGAESVFNFETTPPGTATPFSVTNNGLTATFSSGSSSLPANFTVGPSFFTSLQGNILLDASPTNVPLVVTFSQPVNDLSLNFATNSPGSNPVLSLQAFLGGSSVGTVSVAGTFPPGGLYPEGTLSFAGGPFDSVSLSTIAADFAVDNIRVSAAAPVPVPPAVWGGLALLGGLSFAKRLRRSASPA